MTGMAPQFLAWAQRADAAERAAAASAIARAYLHADLTGAQRHECSVAMAALLDDQHVEVRRALAEAFAASRRAPRALVVALANDRSEVAAPLLARSPLLTDAELVDAVAAGDDVAQCALARRPFLGPGPVGALAEVGTRDAGLQLLSNPDAALGHGTLRRLFERFGDDADVRRALASRADLPAPLKAEIAIADASAPVGFSEGAARARAARDAALAAIAASCPDDRLVSPRPCAAPARRADDGAHPANVGRRRARVLCRLAGRALRAASCTRRRVRPRSGRGWLRRRGAQGGVSEA